MIQRLQYNPVHFKNNTPATQQAATQPAEQKTTIVDKFNKVKKAGTDILKDVNIITNTSGGAVRGVVDGTIATVGIAALGKSLKAAKNQKGLKVLYEIGKSLAQDSVGALKGTLHYAKRIFTEDKAMYKHVGELISLPKKFYCDYMKNNKLLAAGATVVGGAVLALRIFQGKISANEKNANLDHKTRQGHV